MEDLKTQIIGLFLHRLRAILTNKESWFFVPRQENRDCLFQLNMSSQDAIATIRSLAVADYVKGPEQDENGSEGEVWVFTKPYKRTTLYIKVKLYTDHGAEKVTIISFHL